GRFDEANAQLLQARELEPLSLAIMTSAGVLNYLKGDHAAAVGACNAVLQLDPGFGIARYFRGQAYLQQGRYTEAIDDLQSAAKLSGNSSEALSVLGHAYAITGSTAEARKICNDLRERAQAKYVSRVLIAQIEVGLNEVDEAFESLKQACRERSSDLIW